MRRGQRSHRPAHGLCSLTYHARFQCLPAGNVVGKAPALRFVQRHWQGDCKQDRQRRRGSLRADLQLDQGARDEEDIGVACGGTRAQLQRACEGGPVDLARLHTGLSRLPHQRRASVARGYGPHRPHLVDAAGVELEPSVDVEECDAGPMCLEQLLRHRACSAWIYVPSRVHPSLKVSHDITSASGTVQDAHARTQPALARAPMQSTPEASPGPRSPDPTHHTLARTAACQCNDPRRERQTERGERGEKRMGVLATCPSVSLLSSS